MKVGCVDAQKDQHGVSACPTALQDTPAAIAPSTNYAAKTPSEQHGRGVRVG